MSDGYCKVEVAVGHFLPLRRLTTVPARDGKVLCRHRNRKLPPFEIDQVRWDVAAPHTPDTGPVRMRGGTVNRPYMLPAGVLEVRKYYAHIARVLEVRDELTRIDPLWNRDRLDQLRAARGVVRHG
jgi:hypothetical protein